MGKFIDMTGWKMWEHGVPDSRLTVIERVEDYIESNGTHRDKWACKCSCENLNVVFVIGKSLRNGSTKSCGCLKKETDIQNGKRNKRCNNYDITSYGYGIGWARNSGIEFQFDLDDYNTIKNHCWSTCKDHYGYTRIETQIKIDGKYKRKSMAQFLTGQNDIDHIDGDPMNNRRSNLRQASRSQQTANQRLKSNNTSGIIGVTWEKLQQKWKAEITVNKNKIRLGTFTDKVDAIKARLKAEQKYFGEFAPQKHLYEQYGIIKYEENINELC